MIPKQGCGISPTSGWVSGIVSAFTHIGPGTQFSAGPIHLHFGTLSSDGLNCQLGGTWSSIKRSVRATVHDTSVLSFPHFSHASLLSLFICRHAASQNQWTGIFLPCTLSRNFFVHRQINSSYSWANLGSSLHLSLPVNSFRFTGRDAVWKLPYLTLGFGNLMDIPSISEKYGEMEVPFSFT